MILLSAAAAVLLAPNILSAGRDDDAFGRANSLIEQGNRKQSGGDPDAAISLYTLALTLAPRLPAAYVGRGIAEEAIGKLAEAVHDYRQAIRINPDFAVAHNDYASVLYQEGNIDEALAEFAKAIKLDKHLPEPHLARGMIYLFQGKMEMAIDDFTKAIELFPSYFANGGELVVRNPRLARSYNFWGMARQAAGDLGGAISDYDKAVEIDRQAAFYSNRANALAMRKEYDAALKDYSTALTIDPRMADVYFNRGRIRLLNRDLDNAISDFDMALKQRSHLGGPAAFRSEGDSPDQIAHLTYIDRGVAWEAKGSFARARADFDSAIEIDPSAADGYMNRSRVLQKQGLLDQSLEDINKAVNLNPQSALPYLERAIVLMLEGKLKDAERDMQRSITIDSTLKSLADRRSEEAMERRSGARGAGCCEKEFGHR